MGVSADMCQCDVELPCKSCPKGNMQGKHTSAWFQLGCKRGELKDEMSKIRLCPQSQGKLVIDDYGTEVFQQVNEDSCNISQRRQQDFAKALTGNLSLLHFESDLELFIQSLEIFQTNCKHKSGVDNYTLLILLPLHECLFYITWEGFHCPQSRSTLGASHTMLEQLVILRSAANYQATYFDVSN
jgi:hypothetical protein